MKVVQDLVTYFDRRGKLSRRELRRLLDTGGIATDAPNGMHGLCDVTGAVHYFRVTGAPRARCGAPTPTRATPASARPPCMPAC